MKITFSSVKEATRFLKIRKRRRNRRLKTILWILWGMASLIGVFRMFLSTSSPTGVKLFLELLAFVSVGVFILNAVLFLPVLVNRWSWTLEREAEKKKEEEEL